MRRVIHLQPAAPAKPAEGAACNGCGVCCAYAPCPVGKLISRRVEGACDALVFDPGTSRYLCGVVATPAAFLPGFMRLLAPAVARIARRMIAADTRCDCSLVVESGSQR